jgi:hypothetical protein
MNRTNRFVEKSAKPRSHGTSCTILVAATLLGTILVAASDTRAEVLDMQEPAPCNPPELPQICADDTSGGSYGTDQLLDASKNVSNGVRASLGAFVRDTGVKAVLVDTYSRPAAEVTRSNAATTSVTARCRGLLASAGEPDSFSLFPASEGHVLRLLEICDGLDDTCAESRVQRMLMRDVLPNLVGELAVKLQHSEPDETRAFILRVLRDCICHAGHAEAASSLDWQRLSIAVAKTVVRMRSSDTQQRTWPAGTGSLNGTAASDSDLVTTLCLRALYELVTTDDARSLCGLSGSDRQALSQIYLDLERRGRFWGMRSYVCYAVLSMCNMRTLETLRGPPSRFAQFYFDSDSAGSISKLHRPCDLCTDLWMFLAPPPQWRY